MSRLTVRSGFCNKLLLAFFSILFSLFLIECAVRTYEYVQGDGFFGKKGNVFAAPQQKKVIPFRTFGFDYYVTENGKTFISDSWKRRFPLEKPPGTFRVVCMGGSTTQGIDEKSDYPMLLQAELQKRTGLDSIEVINVGKSSYATPHSIILLELDVISWAPDLVIMSHNINDLTVMYWPGFRADYWNKFTNDFYIVPDLSGRYTWNNVVFQHSRLYWLARQQLIAKRHEKRSRNAKIQRRSYGDKPLPEAENIFHRNIKTFVSIAQSYGIDVMLGTQPLEPSEINFLRDLGNRPYNDVVIYPLHKEFVKHHAAYNKVIMNVGEEMSVPVIDNASVLDGNPDYFIDDVHYTDLGVQKLSASFADAIVSRYFGTDRD